MQSRAKFKLLLTAAGLAVAAATSALAQPTESKPACTAADFKGLYVSRTFGNDFRQTPSAPISITSTAYADGQGEITLWVAGFTLGLGAPPTQVVELDQVAAAESIGSRFTYEVKPDCRLTISGRFPISTAPEGIDLILSGGIGNGGKEVFLRNATPNDILVESAHWIRVEDFNESLEERIDALTAIVERIEALAIRIAIRQGINPVGILP